MPHAFDPPTPPDAPASEPARAANPRPAVPWQIWVIVVLLAVEGVGNFFAMFDNAVALYWLLAKCLFIAGLIKGWQWMFWGFLAVAIFHVVGFAIAVPVAAFLNLLMIVLLIWARHYFFAPNRLR